VAKLSKRYATALFRLSLEHNRLEENMAHAAALQQALSQEQSRRVLTHPRIPVAEKHGFFSDALQHTSADIRGLVCLAIDKNREKFIASIFAAFIAMGNQHLRQTTAQVRAAVPLSPKQADALAATLSRQTGKTVTLDVLVDPSLIGGLYIQLDGQCIDRTIKTRLLAMKNHVKGDPV